MDGLIAEFLGSGGEIVAAQLAAAIEAKCGDDSFWRKHWLKEYLNDFKRCPELCRALISGLLTVEQLMAMSPYERNPAANQEIMAELRDQAALNATKTAMNETDAHTCGRCKGTRCTVSTVQSRSVDEPSKITITCIKCSNSWRG